MSGEKIGDALREALAGRYARVSHRLVTDLKTARRLGLPYRWEMAGLNRPTGRVIVYVPPYHPLAKSTRASMNDAITPERT